jgi:hypothetical protein
VERRSKFRSLTDFVVRCRVPASPEQATVQDLSRDGCKVVTQTWILERGTTILLELGATRSTIGCVMWAKGNHAGIQFEKMVPAALVEAFESGSREPVTIKHPRP